MTVPIVFPSPPDASAGSACGVCGTVNAPGTLICTTCRSIVCGECGWVNAPDTDLCARPGCHRTLLRNSLARKHGLSTAPRTAEDLAAEQEGRQLAAQSITDAGGPTELSARELSDHHYRGILHVRIVKLARALDTFGEFDKRHRLRTRWIELLQSLIATAVSVDKTLGLQRRTKQVPTPHEYLDAQPLPKEPDA